MEGFLIEGLTGTGRGTAKLLQVNRFDRVEHRREVMQ